MTTRLEIVVEARSWVLARTPFMHQANLKGVGCDCAGLLRGVALVLGLLPADYQQHARARPFVGYGERPHGGRLRLGCEAYMDPIDRSAMQPGDAILVRFESDPQHLAILGDYLHGGLSMIHALGTADGKGHVVEHRLDATWSRRIVAAYAFRGVE